MPARFTHCRPNVTPVQVRTLLPKLPGRCTGRLMFLLSWHVPERTYECVCCSSPLFRGRRTGGTMHGISSSSVTESNPRSPHRPPVPHMRTRTPQTHAHARTHTHARAPTHTHTGTHTPTTRRLLCGRPSLPGHCATRTWLLLIQCAAIGSPRECHAKLLCSMCSCARRARSCAHLRHR